MSENPVHPEPALTAKVVGRILKASGLSISVAESCTGGLIAARLTDIPGSSEYFTGGVVAYSNALKMSLLGVPKSTLDLYGAVSKETAVAMACGIRELTSSGLGLAVTGIAGPGGGSPAKPTGLVYISLASGDETICEEYRFPGERADVRCSTVDAALNLVKQFLLSRPA
ncbi:MAG: Nicotinamide-nucleotide amidohydrolase PncC [Firmicutes bacterium ADurb.Bin456]|nr:MAG: Nicotinamide-nucleotide amidohydrolase PncC [Firmicutes bacterium ADurb.Bin456]